VAFGRLSESRGGAPEGERAPIMPAAAPLPTLPRKGGGKGVRGRPLVGCAFRRSASFMCRKRIYLVRESGFVFVQNLGRRRIARTNDVVRHPEVAAISASTRVFDALWRPSKGDGRCASKNDGIQIGVADLNT